MTKKRSADRSGNTQADGNPQVEQPRARLKGMRASDISKKRIPWFWPNWLEWESVAIMQGQKGAGKSSWLRAIAAHVSGGRQLPGFKGKQKRLGDVLWFAGEESVQYRVRPGLEAAGADLKHCHCYDLRDDDESAHLYLPRCADMLVEEVRETKAKLIVIDPIFSFSDGTLDLDGPTVPMRRFMRRLQRICEQTGCLLLFARNLTKDTSRGAISSGRGGGEMANASRSVLHCHTLPGEDHRYGLAVALCNNGAPVETITYRIQVDDGQGYVVPEGRCKYTADDLVGGDDRGLEKYAKDRAKDLIRDMLPKGKMESSAIRTVAEAAMISPRTLQAAAKELGITYERKGSQADTECWWIAPRKYP